MLHTSDHVCVQPVETPWRCNKIAPFYDSDTEQCCQVEGFAAVFYDPCPLAQQDACR
jgi:hypothetical protein